MLLSYFIVEPNLILKAIPFIYLAPFIIDIGVAKASEEYET